MAPTPQECSRIQMTKLSAESEGNRVVISGMSGLYPDCSNVKELSELLYNKENPISHPRWKFEHPEAPAFCGSIPTLDRFDANFFFINKRLANAMDLMSRKLLEQAYQCIFDAGISPEHINGKNVGVFVGSCFSESEKIYFYDINAKNGYGVQGASKTMFANRISYWLNTKGPSMTINTLCCSSLTALEQAYLAIEYGDCDAAIVGGSFLCLHPQTSIHYGRAMSLASDGKTKSFCQDAEGCALSESINCLFLQRAKDAKRIYASVMHAKSEFSSLLVGEAGPKLGHSRDSAKITNFLETFYDEAKVFPRDIEYVEAFGSANQEADKCELEVLDKVFCKDRTEPLLVGSVKSNIGYNEAASGISGITKVLLGYHKGELAANLHCTHPRNDLPALQEGRMHVLSEHQPFNRTYAAVNSVSLAGVNAHVLLKGHYIPKDLSRYKSNIPRLVTVAGRNESAVEKILNDLKSRPVDPEEIALLHSINESNTYGHMSRGFTILDTDAQGETVCLSEKKDHFDDVKRPLWFVYSGMGSQWPTMGAQLMRIPAFNAAIQRCHKALEPKGLDIISILTSPDKHTFDNILHSFVGIAAVQIGLTDVLRELGIVPDMIIGHSVGELGCAYGDGCFTIEETILAAYSRGLVSVETNFIRGSMAAIGIGYQQIKELVPPEIEVACHNGPDSSTISGPAEIMKEFVAKLTAQGIFAKEVPCSNIAFHSRYIAEAGPKLLELLNGCITSPKPRSDRWVSTSLPQNRWNEPEAKYCSAWYHTNNLLNPVLFEETSRLIPSNAVVVEIAPHGLLQAILKRSLSSDCKNIPLTKRGHPDNAMLLLEAIGSLFIEGYNPKIKALYPPVDFPVSTTTPMLSHLVEWVHDRKMPIPTSVSSGKKAASVCKFIISIYDDEHSYLQGHQYRGKTLYPFAASLVAVWDTLAMVSGVTRKQLSVEFRDVHLYAQPPIHDLRPLKITVSLHKGSGLFEVTDEFSKIATGTISAETGILRSVDQSSEISDDLLLNSEDIYRLLLEKDYTYRGDFQSIHNTKRSFTQAQLLWNNNWETLIDGLLQLNALRLEHETVSSPTHINKMTIDVAVHEATKTVQDNNNTLMTANVSPILELTRCGGIVLEIVKFYSLPVLMYNDLDLKPLLRVTPNEQPALKDKQVSVTLQCGDPGDLSSMRWVEAIDLEDSENTVTVFYAGVNDLDAKRATGVVPFKQEDNIFGHFGMDFSGVTQSGQRVMGLVQNGAVSTSLSTSGGMTWPVPAHWTLEDAATVPSAYVQAFYCLGISCQLLPGMTVLVQSGAGALGQAAIAIALANDCQVFTTVSSINKKKFLRRLFPKLEDDHIGNSRDSTFANMVLRATKGKGCDIVLTHAPGELKNIILNCSAYCGITIDTNQVFSEENCFFGMNHLTMQRSYVVVDVTSIFDYSEDVEKLQLMMSEGIVRGYVRPLSRITYEAHEAERAFRLLAAGRSYGRTLLKLRDAAGLPTVARLSSSPGHNQVVLCDNGSFGVQWANRLVKRGAKKLYLHSVQLTPYLNVKVQAWQKSGVQVEVSSSPLNNKSDVEALLKDSVRLGPVEGIYVVTATNLSEVSSVVASLDSVSRQLCPSLKYFAVLGDVEQTVQQTCLNRARDQLPATALNLPPININKKDITEEPIDGAVHYRSALEACETALRASQPALVAHVREKPRRDLFQDISTVAEIEIPDNASGDTTLNSLKLDDSKLETICAFLFNNYNISLDEDDIPTLTIQKIRELEEHVNGPVLEEASGLATFFSKALLSPDELVATTDIVFMSTRSCEYSMEDNEIDVNQNILIIVPGLEGHHERFRALCERVKLPALVLQPGLYSPNESLQETAARYDKIISKKLNVKNNFYLLGYESGVLVALEMASLLESRGLQGTVFCVGGAPEEILATVEMQLLGLDPQSLQNAISLHFCKLSTGENVDGLEATLKNLGTWREKVDATLRALEGRTPHTLQYMRALIEAAHARLEQVRRVDVKQPQLRSRIVQLRSSSCRDAPQVSMQKYSIQPLLTYDLSMPLAHASSDPRIATIINRNIDTAILDEYEKKNLCEMYEIDSFFKIINDENE